MMKKLAGTEFETTFEYVFKTWHKSVILRQKDKKEISKENQEKLKEILLSKKVKFKEISFKYGEVELHK